MRIVDLIDKKKRKGIHTKEEINFLIREFHHSSRCPQLELW